MIAEIETGTDGTDVRCGVIKVGTAREPNEPAERLFRAAAAAALATGAPVITHTSSPDQAAWHIRVLEGAGMDMTHVVISHMGAAKDVARIWSRSRAPACSWASTRSASRRGRPTSSLPIWCAMPATRGSSASSSCRRTWRAGRCCRATAGAATATVFRDFVPMLDERGIPAATIETMLLRQSGPDADLRQGEGGRIVVLMAVDRRASGADHSSRQEDVAMAWYDRFKKYRNPEEMRWVVFVLAALAGFLALLLSGRISPAQTARLSRDRKLSGRGPHTAPDRRRQARGYGHVLFERADRRQHGAGRRPSRRNTGSRSISIAPAPRKSASASSMRRAPGAIDVDFILNNAPAMEALNAEKLL